MKKKKVFCIIQARMNSKRLPGKVMKIINNKPMIYWVITNIKKVKLYDGIILALPKNSNKDKIIYNYVKKNFSNMLFYFGSEKNVLDRYYKAAQKFKAKIISRVTADDPLKDPKIISESLKFFLKSKLDYYSNTIDQSFPIGLDIEHFNFKTLKKIKFKAKSYYDKEHVTTYIKSNPEMFNFKNFYYKINLSNFRFTVDTKKDLKNIKKIFKLKKNNPKLKFNTLVKFL